MRDIFIKLLAVSVFCVFFISCDRNLVFENYKPVPASGWHKDSAIVFNIPITDTINQQNIRINIRNKIIYSYSNLWLFVEMIDPAGNAVKDTFGLTLASPTGKWLGEGFGKIRTQQVIYKRNVSFPSSGKYTIKIQHGMRDEILKGISDVGFRVEKISAKTSE